MYDVIVVGGGPGGYVAAIKSAQLGMKVALVERDEIGGVCLNWGCIPTKALLKSARVYQEILKGEFFGIDGVEKSSLKINWEQMGSRKDMVVKRLVNGVKGLLKKNGIDVFMGTGVFKDTETIVVGDKTLKTKNLIIATGSRPSIPDIEGLPLSMEKGIAITSKGALQLSNLPKDMVILGGGVISVEFATLFNALGTKVTLLQRSSRILNGTDEELAMSLQRHLADQGVQIITNCQLKKVEGNQVICQVDGRVVSYSGEKILVSLGRQPNVEGMESLGITYDKKGINVDAYLQTNVPGVYAIGDVNGKYQLAHLASAEGVTAAENIAGKKNSINYKLIPSCIYSFPELASVGMTEVEAKEEAYDVVVSKFPLSANGKALAEGESIGFVKIISEKRYGEILGVHIMAVHATDMISEAVVSMEMEGTVHDVAKAIHPHPTLSEIVMEAAHGAIDKPIHF